MQPLTSNYYMLVVNSNRLPLGIYNNSANEVIIFALVIANILESFLNLYSPIVVL